jgi:hypothetical protein
MQQDQGQQQGSLFDVRQTFDWLQLFCGAASFPICVWLTRPGTWGVRYPGITGLLGLVWPLLFAAYQGPVAGVVDVYRFWLLTLGLLAVHALVGIVRRLRGYRPHSHFWGDSYWYGGAKVSAMQAARLLDCGVAAAAGFVCLFAGSRPLGLLLFIGAGAKLIADGVQFQAVAARRRQFEDARIENEFARNLVNEG